MLALLAGAPAVAQDEQGFQAYLAEAGRRAVAQGVSSATVAREFAGLTLNSRVIALDRAQPGNPQNPGFSPFAPYRAQHVDTDRITRGRAVFQAQRGRLAAIERQTGVPEAITVAIWGHETNYGAYTGNFDLVRSLASLAYEGRRRALFEGELIAALEMIDRGTPREQLKGSWAGATGNPQFLPSIYLRVGRDGDGDGRVDIWNSQADTLASIANYFVDAGWRSGQPWGVAVTVPAGFDRSGTANRLVSPRCPRVFQRHSGWRSVAEWRALGLQPQGAWPADDVQATLIEPDGEGRTAYLLTGNYRVILDYNCSNFYALSVGLLAGCAGGTPRAHAAAAPAIVYAATGLASWYGEELAGARTASGERFDPAGITAAHRTLPLGSLVEVTDLATGRAVLVRINDRGPHRADRVIDLSRGAARLLGMDRRPVASVRLVAVGYGREGTGIAGGGGARTMTSLPVPPGRYLVQVDSFSDRDRAAALADRLGADLEPAGGVWRVRMGPFDAPGAQRVRDEVADRGYADAQLLATD